MGSKKRYKLIGYCFGSPPIGSIMYWDDGYDAWVVDCPYGSSSKSIWSGNPEDHPHLYELIDDALVKKNIKKLGL